MEFLRCCDCSRGGLLRVGRTVFAPSQPGAVVEEDAGDGGHEALDGGIGG